MKEKWSNPIFREMMASKQRGKHHSEETKEKLRIFQLGRKSHAWKHGLYKDKEHIKEIHRLYREKRGKHYLQEVNFKRRALFRNAGKITASIIQTVYEDNIKKYGTLTCYLCLNRINFGQDSVDHKVALSRGGSNEYSNLGIAHMFCNKSKHNKTEEEYREWLKSK